MTRSGRNRRSGFTLLELVVLLVFVGILAVMAGTKVSAVKYQNQVVSAASTVQTQLETAFAIAGRNRAPVRITYTSSTGKLTIAKRDGTVTYNTVDFTTMGLKGSEVTFSASPVDVFPNGWASNSITVTISAYRAGVTYLRTVTMGKAGLIKLT